MNIEEAWEKFMNTLSKELKLDIILNWLEKKLRRLKRMEK